MPTVLGALTCAACLLQGVAGLGERDSYVHKLVPGPQGVVHQVEPYVPQPGDLVFFDDYSEKWHVLYKMVGSGPPFHSGIVVLRPDGSPALLEAGPNDTMHIRILDAVPRLQGFHGAIYIRQLRQPLTREQSAVLTHFALAQDGKHYALGRLLLQATPIRCRSSWRYQWFGKTYLNRSRWLCAELVVAAGTSVGLFDPQLHPANAIYPRDIVFDTKYDLSATWYEARLWTPSPQQGPYPLVPR